MIICDRCKSLKAKPFDVKIKVVKVEETTKKSVDREIIAIPMHLCDKCIAAVNQDLTQFTSKIRNIESSKDAEKQEEWSNVGS